jgi:hypothetical protein
MTSAKNPKVESKTDKPRANDGALPYSRAQLLRMDARFTEAMREAIAAGLEHPNGRARTAVRTRITHYPRRRSSATDRESDHQDA